MIDFKENKGVWFYFIEGRPESICLKQPTLEDYDEIQKVTVEEGKPDYHRGVRYPTEVVDKKYQRKLQSRKLIIDWIGVGLNGTELECNSKNIDKMLLHPDFNLFVADCLDKLLDGNKTIDEARLKNLEDSPDGDSAQEEDSAEKSA